MTLLRRVKLTAIIKLNNLKQNDSTSFIDTITQNVQRQMPALQ